MEHNQEPQTPKSIWKQRWLRMLCFFIFLWILTGLSIILFFVMRQNILGVVMSSVIFFACLQMVYCYSRFKLHQSRTREIRRRMFERNRIDSSLKYNPENDKPPTYEEIYEYEIPPPSYYEIIKDSQKTSNFPHVSPTTSIKSKKEIIYRPSHFYKHHENVSVPVHQHHDIHENETDGGVENLGYQENQNTFHKSTSNKQRTRHNDGQSSSSFCIHEGDVIRYPETITNSNLVNMPASSINNDALSTIRIPILKNMTEYTNS